MKTMILGVILAGLLSVSGQTQSESKKAVPPKGVPASAEKVSDGVWKWKDQEGKSWLYNQTAFGYSRTADLDEKSAGSGTSTAQAGLRVVDVKPGEVSFEQPTPFGKSRWTRAKADMNAAEKAAYEAHEKSAKSAPAAK